MQSYKITNSIFLLLITIYFIYLLNYPQIITKWVVADLLINYEGGFVRRGLLGQINLFFENTFKFPKLLIAVIITSFILFFNIFITYFRIYKNKNYFFLFLIIFLSPATFLFYIYDTNAFLRKDVFIIFTFILHCFYIQFNYTTKYFIKNYRKKLFILITALTIVTLIYEVQFILLPFHIMLSYSIIRNFRVIIFFYSVPLIIFFLSFIYKGSFLVAENIRNSLQHYPTDIIYQLYNPIHWLEGNLNLAIGGSLKLIFFYSYIQIIELIIAIFLSVIVFYSILSIYFNKFILENKNLKVINLKFIKKNSYKFILVCFFCFFFIGFDTGRAIHILSMHIISLFLIFIPKENSKTIFNYNRYNKVIILFLFFYTSLWILPSGYVGIDTIFKSGLFFNFKIFFSYSLEYFSKIIKLPQFLLDLTKEYLIFNKQVIF